MANKEHDLKMMMLRLPKLKGEEIKVEKTKDYYNVFSSILKVEDESIRDNRHYWVLGIDDAGYVVCVYIFSINPENLMKISLKKIFRAAIMFDAVDVVLAYNVRDDESLVPSPENVAFFNKVFNLSDSVLELRTLDMMIISTKGCHSDKEDGYFDFYTRDMSFKIYYDVKGRIRHLKKRYGRKKAFEAMEKGITKGLEEGKIEGLKEGKVEGKQEGFTEGKREEKIEIVKEMLKENYDIKSIIKLTKLSEKEINKIKKDMGLPS